MKVVLTAATIAKLQLGQDDVVVISVTDENRKLTEEQGERLVGQAKKLLGPDTKVIVLPYGLAISKIEKDEVST